MSISFVRAAAPRPAETAFDLIDRYLSQAAWHLGRGEEEQAAACERLAHGCVADAIEERA